MIVGAIPESLTNQFTVVREQLGDAVISSSTIIIEAAYHQHQVASLAFASRILQQTKLTSLGDSPNVLIIMPDSETSGLKLEDVKLIQQHFRYKAVGDALTVAIIPDATQLSVPVQNALLKTAEELQFPQYLIFGVQHSTELLQTLQSRCQVITTNVKEQVIADVITNFLNTFLKADITIRRELIENNFSKKTKKGQQQRDRIEDYIIGLQRLGVVQSPGQQQKIEYFRKICHTVNSQMIFDSFLFL